MTGLRTLGQNLNAVESIGFAASDKHIEAILVGHKTHWPPMLPQDRNDLVNEMVQRLSGDVPTISQETAIRRLDGADELAEELARIEADQQKAQERQMEMAEKEAEMGDEQADKDMDRSMQQAEHKNKLDMQRDKAKPKDRTNNAQAKGGRAKNNGK